MELENPVDFGGDSIDKFDIISDDLICKIKNLNPVLGTPDDPMYDRYKQYREEFENAELIVIDANALNRNSINNMDLSGSYGSVDDLPSTFFQLIADTLEIAYGSDEYGINSVKNPNEGFEAFTDFGDTEFSPFAANY